MINEINWEELTLCLLKFSQSLCKDYALGEDLVQDTIFKLLQRGFKPNDNVKKLCKTILFRKYLNILRKNNRNSFVRNMLSDMEYNSCISSERLDAQNAIREITKDQSAVLTQLINLRSQGESFAEIAFILNRNEALCRKYFSNFSKQVRESHKFSMYFNFDVRLAVNGLDLLDKCFAIYGSLDSKREGIYFTNGKECLVSYDYFHTYNCDARLEIQNDILFCRFYSGLDYKEKKSLEISLRKRMLKEVFVL